MKSISKIIYLIGLLLCVEGCKNPNPNPAICRQDNCYGVWLDYQLALQYKDNNSVDLLDTNSVLHYDMDSIKIYLLASDGCIVYYFNEMSQLLEPDNNFAIKGFDIRYYVNTGYFFVLDLYGWSCVFHKHGNKYVENYDTDAPRTIYVQFNENDTDTINAEIAHLCGGDLSHNAGRYCTYDVYGAVRYNGDIIVSSWENNQEKMLQGIYPTVIKD
ncbi:MAG: hypothetical protein LBC68_09625 [Prevotellaceae bacterium]|jgi:hypothetical protein|nr:hypothetical protein [Prevotellaceae bacterium]